MRTDFVDIQNWYFIVKDRETGELKFLDFRAFRFIND